jgi:hypothetical protein
VGAPFVAALALCGCGAGEDVSTPETGALGEAAQAIVPAPPAQPSGTEVVDQEQTSFNGAAETFVPGIPMAPSC